VQRQDSISLGSPLVSLDVSGKRKAPDAKNAEGRQSARVAANIVSNVDGALVDREADKG